MKMEPAIFKKMHYFIKHSRELGGVAWEFRYHHKQ